jgi:hypothetical protein
VQFCALDILALDGDDLRRLPLSMRKTNLSRLLARRPDGIFVAPLWAYGPLRPTESPAIRRRLVLGSRNRPTSTLAPKGRARA